MSSPNRGGVGFLALTGHAANLWFMRSGTQRSVEMAGFLFGIVLGAGAGVLFLYGRREGADSPASWFRQTTNGFLGWFDRLFDFHSPRHFFRRAALASLLAAALLTLARRLLWPEEPWPRLSPAFLLAVGFNTVVDWLSLQKTRRLVEWAIKRSSRFAFWLAALADPVLSAGLFYVFVWLVLLALAGAAALYDAILTGHLFGDVLEPFRSSLSLPFSTRLRTLQDPAGIFLYSTLLAPALLWLHSVAQGILRIPGALGRPSDRAGSSAVARGLAAGLPVAVLWWLIWLARLG